MKRRGVMFCKRKLKDQSMFQFIACTTIVSTIQYYRRFIFSCRPFDIVSPDACDVATIIDSALLFP